MLGISVELGTYSIKFLNFKIEKKQTQLINTEEIIIDFQEIESGDSSEGKVHQDDQSFHEYQLWNYQLEIIKNYLASIDFEYQLFLNFPSEVVSMRYIQLPIKNRKKAMMMLPFQIEEDLPFSLSTCHWAESIRELPNFTEATVGIIRKEHFNHFFNLLKTKKILPNILTTDVSNFENFLPDNITDFPKSFCILNIGHESTRGYYFHDGKLVANHQSYVAGKTLTESISKTYSISSEEATLYKHQNSFFLLPEQYEEVNENQREFAKVMDATFSALISDIKRWDIGFRVQNGEAIKEIYICGGTTNIKNIKNYLSSKLGAMIHHYDPYKFLNSSTIDQDENLRRKFSQVATLTGTTTKKSKIINFLKGDYALNSSNELPLESMAFIGVRMAFLSLILAFYFIVKGVSLNLTLKKSSEKHLNVLYNNPKIKSKITKSVIRRGKNNPSLILNKLDQQDRMIEQEVKVIQSSLKNNAFNKLLLAIEYFDGNEVEVLKFVTDNDNNVDIIITAKELKQLKTIQENFNKDKNIKWFVTLNETKKELSVGGKIKI